ncbi:MAG: hypothetical protein II826_09335 [Prevotella sp.]|nr:hypothetical protein [Prevotella sp.]
MKIDFSQVPIRDIEGNAVAVDISKELGNMMYLQAQDIAVADLGHDIYHRKEVNLTREQAQTVRMYVEQGFKAIVKRELLPLLDKAE